MFNRFLKLFSSSEKPTISGRTQVIPKSVHGLDDRLISASALKVISALQRGGHTAFLVGGGVRDLLLDGKPKDFDIATDATPEQIKSLFRSAIIIGRRFRIVHVRFGREVIEVTTFRAHHSGSNSRDAEQSASGLLLRDNVYGDIESDAIRRDFTINALYYDPSSGDLLDFTQGLEHLNKRTLRIIGDPEARYREDPVRMLRAVRFAAKLGFSLDKATGASIPRMARLLDDIPPARLFEEVLKLMLSGSATATLEQLRATGLLQYLFPGTDYCLNQGDPQAEKLVTQAVVNTDKRIRQQKRVTPAFIYAAFLWLPLQAAMRKLVAEGDLSPAEAMQQAAQTVISQQLASTSIPKRFLIPMREIWSLQLRLPRREGQRAAALLGHPRFRAAYDFLLLREESGEQLDGLGMWWTRFQDVSSEQQDQMARELGQHARKRRPKRRKKPTPPTPTEG